jgi:V/A-type H+-transporting ATPase subunit I
MSIRPLVSVSLAVERSKRQALVDALQGLGVAHIRPLTLGEQDESDAKPVIDPEQLTQALRYLEGAAHKRRQQVLLPSEVNERLTNILKHQIQRGALKARLDFLNQRIKSLAPWGDFEWPPLEALSGYRLWFYRIPARQMKHLETLELPWQEVHRTPDLHYIVVLSKDEPGEHALPVPRTHTGPVRLSELKAEKEQCLDHLEQMDAERSSLTRWYDALQNTRSRIQDDAQKAAVLKHALNRSGFTGLSFWMDPLHASALSPLCDHFNAACVVSDVKAGDHPPTLLSNPSFFAGGQAAVQFFQTPGYRSWDPSRVVFFSFALFFALIVSDFGYAAVMAAGLGLFTPRLQQGEKSRRMLGLLWVMIAMAMVWGALVGSYFGYEPQGGVLDTLHVLDLHDFNSMIALSVTLGVGHLVIANAMMAWVHRRGRRRWASVGWCLVLMASLLSYLISPQPVLWGVMLVGLVMIVLYSSQEARLSKRLLGGAMSLTKLTTLLGNALSYLRLFALGLASASMALTFNQLAGQVVDQLPGIGLVLAGFILLLGHLLNFALTVVSGVIHGLRLNLIEFFNWSLAEEGYAFEPFRKQEVTRWTDS